MSVLSSRQQDDLHKAILDYLSEAGYTKTFQEFLREAPGMAGFQPDPKLSGLLTKKWTSVIRMQKKIIDLEARLAATLEELSQVGHLSSSGQKANKDWLPAFPAKHVLTGHRDGINAISFHPTFSSLASASRDSTVKVWDWETGDLETTLKGHTKEVTDCQYDSVGKRLATCSNDLFIKLWDVDNNYNNSATLRGHDHAISSVAFAAGDDRIVSASRDRTVRVWEIATSHCIKVINAHDDWIRSALPSSDSKWLLTCGNDFTARITDLETGRMKAELRGHDHIVEAAIFAPPNASQSIRELVASGASEPIAKIEAQGLAFVVTASRDKTIKLWDALRAVCLKTFVGHDNWVKSLVFHPSGNFLLSAGDDATIRVWDLKTGRCVKTLDSVHKPFVSCMAWGRQTIGDAEGGDDKKRLVNVIASGGMDKCIKIWLPARQAVSI